MTGMRRLPGVIYRDDPFAKQCFADGSWLDLTMGEAFEVEAQRPQGSRPMKSRLEAHDRRVSYANAVHIRYLEIEGQKTRTLADCIQEVADKHGIGFETVHDAYVEHRDHVHASLNDLGILRG